MSSPESVPPYRPPATRDEVPMIRLLGGHFDQQHRLIEHVCCCPEPCNSYKCPNQQYLAPPAPSAPSRAEKIAAAIVPEQLDQYLPASETNGGETPVGPAATNHPDLVTHHEEP